MTNFKKAQIEEAKQKLCLKAFSSVNSFSAKQTDGICSFLHTVCRTFLGYCQQDLVNYCCSD